jgi:hypothetical protein
MKDRYPSSCRPEIDAYMNFGQRLESIQAKDVRGTRSPRCKRHRIVAIHQSVTEELAMQKGFNVNRRRLYGAQRQRSLQAQWA